MSEENRKSIFVISLIFLVLVMGCNTYRDFVIVNMSGETIEVEYELIYTKILDAESPKNIMSLEEFNSEKGQWKSPNQAENSYTIDQKNNKLKVKILPNQVFKIDTADVEKLERYAEDKYRIKYLKITGKYGEVILKDHQVFNNFQQEERNWSLIEENTPTFIYYYKEQ